MTHFSYTIPLDMLLRLWDHTFLSGWPGVYRISVALLQVMEEALLVMDLDDLAKMMRSFRQGQSNVLSQSMAVEDVLRRADNVIVTEPVLQQLQENFALEMISAAEVAIAAAVHEEEEREKEREREREKEKAAKAAEDGFFERLSSMSRTVNDTMEGVVDGLASNGNGATNGASSSSASAASLASASSGVGTKTLGALSGREASNWLLRYGDTLQGSTALEMLRIRDELKDLEIMIDHDKQSIQEKIVRILFCFSSFLSLG
jgi:hypothetical protein